MPYQGFYALRGHLLEPLCQIAGVGWLINIVKVILDYVSLKAGVAYVHLIDGPQRQELQVGVNSLRTYKSTSHRMSHQCMRILTLPCCGPEF